MAYHPPPDINNLAGYEINSITPGSGPRYQLVSLIGQRCKPVWINGKFHSTAVYECFEVHDPLRTLFACKVIPKGMFAGDGIERLEREVDIIYAFRGNPNVIRTNDLCEDDHFVCIIMPIMVNLVDWINNLTSYTEADARNIVVETTRAIAALHARGVCHRNIKLSNLLVSPDGHVVVTDFLVAKYYGRDDDPMTTVCGSKRYMAPEIVRNRGEEKRTYTEKCDCWSLGVVAYILLAGMHPFPVVEDHVYYFIANKDYNRALLKLKGVSDDAFDFIAKLLNKEPSERPSPSDLLASDPWLNAPVINPCANLIESARNLRRVQNDDDLEDFNKDEGYDELNERYQK